MNSHYEECGKGIRYLYVIARNLCIEKSRQVGCDTVTEDVSDEGKAVEDMINKLHIEQVFKKMTNENRELLILRYMNEESVTDMCRITGISRFALYRKLKHAKKEFIKLMEEGEICE